MFVRSSRVYYSASDLKAAVECEWALIRKLDAKLGRIEAVEEADDPMLARASLLGGEHEARALENYKTTYADGVVELETEDERADPDILRAAQERTIEALRQGKNVVFQATFFDEPDDSRPANRHQIGGLATQPAQSQYSADYAPTALELIE
jgi:predicted RecB family nuclease